MNIDLPFHPITGLQAIGIVGGKPVYPIIGGAPDDDEDSGSDDGGDDAGGDGGTDDNPDGGDGSRLNRFGYPDDTPLAEMSTPEQLAYWKHKSRMHESKAKDLRKGESAEAEKLKDRIKELEDAQKSDAEKASEAALAKAREDGEKAGREAVLPLLREAQLRAYASIVVPTDVLDDVVDSFRVDKFLDDEGELDGKRVVDYLSKIFNGKKSEDDSEDDKPKGRPNWGQGSTKTKSKPDHAATGLAIAKARGYVKDES